MLPAGQFSFGVKNTAKPASTMELKTAGQTLAMPKGYGKEEQSKREILHRRKKFKEKGE